MIRSLPNSYYYVSGKHPLNLFSILFGPQGSSQKKIKEGVVLRSKHNCVFSDHIKVILPQKGGGGCSRGSPPLSRFG